MSRKKILLHISLLALIVWGVQIAMGGPCFSGIYLGNLLPDDSSLPECAQWDREKTGSPDFSVLSDPDANDLLALQIIDDAHAESCRFRRQTVFLTGPYSGNTAKLTARLKVDTPSGGPEFQGGTLGVFIEIDDGINRMYMCLLNTDFAGGADPEVGIAGAGALNQYETYSTRIMYWNDGAYHTFELTRNSDGSATLIIDTDTLNPLNVPQGSLQPTSGTPGFSFGAAPGGISTSYWDSVQWSISSAEASPVAIDIKPGGCPNPLNVKSKGVLSVAILGKEDFDVFWVDVATVTLQGVAPIHAKGHYEDVSAPVAGSVEECECTEAGPDGFPDLVLHFDIQEIVVAMGEVSDWDEMLLQLDGMLIAAIGAITGSDCVVIRKKGK